jgi:hypothetical protein
MSFALSTPVTGAAQTGLTSPTYTVALDSASETWARQYAVTALGGTQTGVTAQSVASPFTTAMFRPKSFQYLGKPNPTTGLIARVPRNTYKVITSKGVLPLAAQPLQNMVITTTIEVPAGADLADPANVRAALSMHLGSLAQASSGIGDTVVNGVL